MGKRRLNRHGHNAEKKVKEEIVNCGKCGCQLSQGAFRDFLSFRIYDVLKICQQCQDSIYGCEEDADFS